MAENAGRNVGKNAGEIIQMLKKAPEMTLSEVAAAIAPDKQGEGLSMG